MEVLRDPEHAPRMIICWTWRDRNWCRNEAAKIRTFALQMIGLAGVSVVVASAGSVLAPCCCRFEQIDELFHASASPHPAACPLSRPRMTTARRQIAMLRPRRRPRGRMTSSPGGAPTTSMRRPIRRRERGRRRRSRTISRPDRMHKPSTPTTARRPGSRSPRRLSSRPSRTQTIKTRRPTARSRPRRW